MQQLLPIDVRGSFSENVVLVVIDICRMFSGYAVKRTTSRVTTLEEENRTQSCFITVSLGSEAK